MATIRRARHAASLSFFIAAVIASCALPPYEVNKGVAIVGDTLFWATVDCHLIAIDAKNLRAFEYDGNGSRMGLRAVKRRILLAAAPHIVQ